MSVKSDIHKHPDIDGTFQHKLGVLYESQYSNVFGISKMLELHICMIETYYVHLFNSCVLILLLLNSFRYNSCVRLLCTRGGVYSAIQQMEVC